MKQLSVSSGPAATLLVVGNSDDPVPTLIQNVDPVNILFIGDEVGLSPQNPLSCVPLNPGQSTVASGNVNVFGIADVGLSVSVNIYTGVMSFFQPISQLVIQGTAAAVLIYSPTAGFGNLIGSWAATSFVDQYGNVVPAGLNAGQGNLASMNIDSSTITNSIIQSTLLQAPIITAMNATGGTATETTITFDTTGGTLLMYSSTTTTVSFTTPGISNWTSPITGFADVKVWGADAGAGGGSSTSGGEGGGGAEFSEEPNYNVIQGQVYPVNIGSGGTGGNTGSGGSDGDYSSFDNAGVIADGGHAGNNFVGGRGGHGSTASRHFNGGNGGGDGTQSTGGCGGGGRAGSNGTGGNAAKSTTSTGTNGGAAGSGTGGITGGRGGNSAANGSNGGGGGGCGAATQSQQGTSTFRLVSSATYYGSDGGSPNGQRSTGTMYQGGETASGGSFNGTQKSLGVISGNPSSVLAGVSVDTVSLRLECLHSWYNSGLTVVLGYNNRTSLPGSWDGGDITAVKSFGMAQGIKTIDLSGVGLGAALGSGAARSITIGPGPAFNLNYYGFFYGAGGSNSENPLITVTWHTGSTPVKAGNGANGRVDITYTTSSLLVGALSPIGGTDAAGNGFGIGYTGPVQAFQPAAVPAIAEVWHDLPPGANGWGLGTGGWKKYRMLSTGSVELSFSLRLIGTKTDNTNIFGAGALPSGYQPANNKYLPCIVNQNALSSNWPQTIRVNTDGSISIAGVNATTVTQLDFHGTVPLI